MPDPNRQRLVFAACRAPFPLVNGARIRTHRLLAGLAEVFDVELVVFEVEEGHPDGHVSRSELETLLPGISIVTVPGRRSSKRLSQIASLARRESWTNGRYRTAAYTAAMEQAVARHRPQIIHFDDSGVAMVPPFTGALNVYCSHNIEHTILALGARIGSSTRRAFNAIEAKKVAREERLVWNRVDLCLATSTVDAAVMAAAGARNVKLCPNGADPVARLPLRPLQSAEPLRLLFVGSGDYAPYERGLAWMVQRVIPQIRARVPVEFDIVGTPPASPVAAEGVRYIGRVPSVEPYYDAAHVVVVPVFEGSGTRLKIIEAAAYGRPVVSTQLGAEGLPVTPGEHFLLAEAVEEFVGAVLDLEQQWRQPKSAQLEKLVEDAHAAMRALTWPRIVDDLVALYHAEVAQRAPLGSSLRPAPVGTAPDGDPGVAR
ncbi:MAG TPA: glycosyltransferase [Solirubrobacteraceae bacterium]|jgi:glycosyltransferase involved in cell wall biosynthesis|nr:glycosyltransferase [Solirubrobacteraceae bacterium]